MANYIVKRHGSNGANQSMTQTAVVGSIEAKSKKDARERFGEENPTVTIYNNQYLEFVPISKATQEEIDDANEASILHEAEGQYFDSLGNVVGKRSAS